MGRALRLELDFNRVQAVELVQGIVLFSAEASKNGSWTVDDDRLARTVEILGAFPPDFLQKGSRTAEFFDKNDEPILVT